MKASKYWKTTIYLAFSLIFILGACQDDRVFEGDIVPLEFSLDTMRFDTVFTEIGTITRFFKVYNQLDEAVIVDRIGLADEEGFFRINVDGIPGDIVNNTRIEALDSIYVFVEATIDPNQPLSFSPFVIEDQIEIQAGQSEYVVHLEAWGQNANYVPNRFANNEINSLSCNGGTITWDDPKPYVIYGVLGLDDCKLVIAEGTDVYVHGGVGINDDIGVFNDGILVVLPNSSIEIQGTAENPVRIRTDRLEPEFQEVAGQWAGILIQAGSRNNIFNHTLIQHSIVGVSIDSAASLVLNNCQIGYTSGSGLSAEHAQVTANNCLFFQNLTNGISLGYGGSYTFNHCTSANYDNQGVALSANNIRCTDPLCQGEIFFNPLNLTMTNCILTGNDEDEISFFDLTDGEDPNAFRFNFRNSFINLDEILEPEQYPNFFDNCTDCRSLVRQDTLFLDLEMQDFHLDTMSIAIDQGLYLPFINEDLEGNPRESNLVDVGCYEFQK